MTTIVVQAGHTFRKTGSTGTAGEQAFNYAAAVATVRELRRRGFAARMIDADEPISSYRGDGFVAIHADGSTSSSAHGASVGYRNARGKTFALLVKAAYTVRAKAAGHDAHYRADNYTRDLQLYYGTGYAVDANPACRAIILEAGFLTNPTDRAFLRSTAGVAAFARSIADAAERTFGRQIVPASRAVRPVPVVDLSKLVEAARKDPRRPQGGTTAGAADDVRIVERALVAEKLLPTRYAGDGSYGTTTIRAYSAWQRSPAGGSFRGNDANGIPGATSLGRLARRHGFKVTP